MSLLTLCRVKPAIMASMSSSANIGNLSLQRQAGRRLFSNSSFSSRNRPSWQASSRKTTTSSRSVRSSNCVAAYVVGCSGGVSRCLCDSPPTSQSPRELLQESNYNAMQLSLADPQSNAGYWKQLSQKIRRVWRMVRRFLQLSVTLAPVICLYPLVPLLGNHGETSNQPPKDAHAILLAGAFSDDAGNSEGGMQQSNFFMKHYMKLCLTCVESSGAAVIKLMQWAGSRPDLFGHDFCAVFSKLQDATTPHSWKHTEKMLEKAYGTNWRARVRLDEDDILGSGCIGQVYRGRVLQKRWDGEPE